MIVVSTVFCAVVGALFVLPVLDPVALARFSGYYMLPGALAIAVFAMLHGLGRIAQAEERRFWYLFALALLLWLIGDLLYIVKDPPGPPADYIYFGYFIALVVALDQKPHLAPGWADEQPGRMFWTAGALIFLAGVLYYFALIPSRWMLTPGDPGLAPYFAYLIMDFIVAIRLALLFRETRSRRWRKLYGTLAIAAGLMLLTDLRDLLYYSGMGLLEGGWPDLLYLLPFPFLVLATRMRNATPPEAEGVKASSPELFGLSHSGIPGPLWIYALLLPVVHLAQSALGLLDRPAAAEREVTVLFFTMALVVLALWQRTFEQRRNRSLRDQVSVLVTNEQVMQMEKMAALGRLSGGIAHQFNNLLQVIIGRGQLLREDARIQPAQREHLDGLLDASRQAATLTRQLIAFSKQRVLAPTLLELNALVAEHQSLLDRTLGEDVVVTQDLAADPAYIVADAAAVTQIIVKLAVFARESMPRGGRLSLETYSVALDETLVRDGAAIEPGRYVVLVIRDSGTGLDAESLRLLFEPYSLDAQRDGLGLATVYGLVAQLGGRIIASSSPGEGTCFEIFFPEAERLTVGASVPSADAVGSGRLESVLIVDDDRPLRDMLEKCVADRGLSVRVAGNGIEALQICEGLPGGVDLLITDVLMPLMGGLELAKRLRARFPALKVLFISGHVADASLDSLHEDATTRFLHKPFELHELRRTIDQFNADDPAPKRAGHY